MAKGQNIKKTQGQNIDKNQEKLKNGFKLLVRSTTSKHKRMSNVYQIRGPEKTSLGECYFTGDK